VSPSLARITDAEWLQTLASVAIIKAEKIERERLNGLENHLRE